MLLVKLLIYSTIVHHGRHPAETDFTPNIGELYLHPSFPGYEKGSQPGGRTSGKFGRVSDGGGRVRGAGGRVQGAGGRVHVAGGRVQEGAGRWVHSAGGCVHCPPFTEAGSVSASTYFLGSAIRDERNESLRLVNVAIFF
jgi:hypothetical protein